MRKVLVVAPHPDDETLGCGGTLLKHKGAGDSIHWLIVTNMSEAHGYAPDAVRQRRMEISAVAEDYRFDSVHDLQFAPARLDEVPKHELIRQIGSVFAEIRPELVYLPLGSDIHSDHRDVFEAALACSKWFRCGSVRRILAYETLSESEFSAEPGRAHPNVFVDIGENLQRKIEIMNRYSGEIREFPFPRSALAIQSLARLRGSSAGCQAAEAFVLVKEIV